MGGTVKVIRGSAFRDYVFHVLRIDRFLLFSKAFFGFFLHIPTEHCLNLAVNIKSLTSARSAALCAKQG